MPATCTSPARCRKELCGTLYRNGPNPQFAPRGPYHWFGGDGMIHAFHIENGNVSYKNRWVRTPKWEIENKEGEGLSGTFGNPRYTDPRVFALNSTIANTNIVWHGGKLLALEEAHAPFSLDPASLMPVERRLRDLRRQALRALHRPSQARSRDRRDGVLRLLGQGPLHQGGEHPDRDGRRQDHARRDPRRPLPQHDPRLRRDAGTGSCCRSSRSPRRWSARWRGMPPFAWEPDKGTHIAFIPRNGTVADVKWVTAPPCYVFHPMNHLRDGGRQGRGRRHEVRRGAALPAARRLALVADARRRPGCSAGPSILAATANTFKEEQLDDRAGEFPRFDERFCMSDYRHGWIVAGNIVDPRTGEPRMDGITHYDLKTGKSATWTRRARPTASASRSSCRAATMPPRATAGC